MPWPGGRLRLAHIRWSYIRGLYRRPAATLHLSAGLGTTFVPFRFLARPEATELILESGLMEGTASVAGDVLARYAADAAREVEGVAGLVEGRLPRQGAVRISAEDGVTRRAPSRARSPARRRRRSAPRCSAAWPTTSSGWPARGPSAVDVVIDEIA